ncbi:hypothetical protein [Bradyrhizobium elkanii]|uniref:hypothetical protein n=1 Tax=Bradyrhizobium elkanii TaxID=29448 RepID=UPI002729CBD2|nr:hypothetical protein [Bradyrhizobium elkanii]WLA78989.1 hypothetical protein QNJ99_26630 [Bradyrhizobium elkanii]
MSDETWRDPLKGPDKNEVAIDYVKAPDFRVMWADGAFGGVTPNGHVHCALYTERYAIPRRQIFKLDEAGALGPEVVEKQISRGSVVRELSCDLFLSPQTAENLAHWLLSQVALMKKASEE